MNKLLIAFLFLAVVGSNAHAGFWGSMAGSAIGNSVTKKRGYSNERIKKVSSYLWDMHEKGVYEEGYKFYLDYLEQTEDISYLDTVAHVYNDNGDKKKAIEIYEKRILPWVALEGETTKAKFRGYYDEIKNGKIKVPAQYNHPKPKARN
ncbi:MAG: hypothetical protein D3903_00830 [Candidatus Electrothrix sp. GM3_4]|nr:hypothetical protein [Candidatus Electrothrix sp. GM3_4]